MMLNDMEFEKRLMEMGDNQLELIKFVARQTFETCRKVDGHERRIKTLENRDRRSMAASGGIGAVIGSAVIAAIDYFAKR